MAADLKALLHNKKAMAGVGVAGAAGLGVWYYRKSHGGGGSSTTDTAATTDGGSTVPAGSAAGQFPDTSGTDVANWLGNQEGSFQDEFTQFLTDSATQQQQFLSQFGTVLQPAPTPSPVSTPTPVPHPVTPAPPKVKVGTPKAPVTAKPVAHPYVTVERYTTSSPPWQSTLSGIAAHEHTTVAALEKLNGNVDPKKLQIGQHIVYK